MHGAGEGDIGQPLPFGLLLPPRLAIRAVAGAPVPVAMEVEPGRPPRLRVPAPAFPPAPARVQPQIGADHNGVFQSLAAVHRHHGNGLPHLVTVGLLRLRDGLHLLEAPTPQPTGGGVGTEALAVQPLLHQLRHLLQIGQEAPPRGEASQLLRPQHGGQGTEQSLPGPGQGQLLQTGGQRAPAQGERGGDGGGAPAQERRGGQQAQPIGV